ncbi:MAG: hypothetical protein WDN47_02575 [Candidatus Doudnabacteria bacterium]
MLKKISSAILVVAFALVLPRLSSAAVQPPAFLTVIKHVINDNGGTATASDFTMTISGVTVINPLNPLDPHPASFPGQESPGTDRTIISDGTYNVTESGPAGYTATFSAGCTGTLAPFDSQTCTITNDDIAPPPPPPNPCPTPPPPKY